MSCSGSVFNMEAIAAAIDSFNSHQTQPRQASLLRENVLHIMSVFPEAGVFFVAFAVNGCSAAHVVVVLAFEGCVSVFL